MSLSDVAELPFVHEFPATKYMGSKSRLLPFICGQLDKIPFESVLDAFSGSGCVSYALKERGKAVISNDFLSFCYYTAKATVENGVTLLSSTDVDFLTKKNRRAKDFITKTYSGLFFGEADCEFLDNLRANIGQLQDGDKIALALAAASRACMKKRPRGLFTFTGRKGWDGRKDLKLTMREQFLAAVDVFNKSVFDNHQENKAFNCDVFALDAPPVDLVYIDTPYVSPFSDCDYTRRYHFVEGFCRNWEGVEIMLNTKTKKFRSFETAFSTKSTAENSFQRLFSKFKDSVLAVSYSSNCIPDKKTMVGLLKEVKKDVRVFSAQHTYSHGNHQHKVGDNNNEVAEYLFIAQ
jgi:DNA adenine methylase